MKQQKARCPACGAAGSVAKRSGAKRIVAYRGMKLELPPRLVLTQCNKCEEFWLDDDESDAFSEALDTAYDNELSRRACKALGALDDVISQGRLETLLHLSHGYLSKVRNQAKTPSAMLVSQLAMLAADPKRRVPELERFWRT